MGVGERDIGELGFDGAEIVQFAQQVVAVVEETGDGGAVILLDLQPVGVVGVGRDAEIRVLDLDEPVLAVPGVECVRLRQSLTVVVERPFGESDYEDGEAEGGEEEAEEEDGGSDAAGNGGEWSRA